MKKFSWIKYFRVAFTRYLWLYFVVGFIFFQLAQRQPFQVELARLGNQQHFEGELVERLSEGQEMRSFDFVRAINYYKEFLHMLPGQDYAYGNTGYCYVQLNNLSKAIKFYDKAIQANPYIYSYLFDRGMIFFDRKEYEKAILNFQQALKVMPQTLDYYRKLVSRIGATNSNNTFSRYLAIAANQAKEDEFIAQIQVARSRFYLDKMQGPSTGKLSPQEREKLEKIFSAMEEKYQDNLSVKRNVHFDSMFGPYLGKGLLFLRLDAEKKR
ncbi:MAG: tetratricopeptide repeat protein [Candidatus Aceula meridiana]|nr:tetratricopeptide repeat protein [Candidatus Aceula meridiana]